MRLRFREKTYLITLLLFLVFFNAGIFSLAYYTYQNNMDGEEALCRDEERVIAEAFENDYEFYGYIENRQGLISTYGEFYLEKGINLRFISADSKYSNLPSGLVPPAVGNTSTQKWEGKRYFLISRNICENKYIMTYAKDISYVDEDFFKISVVFIVTSLCASALLAMLLFLVLRKLSKPLDKLRSATEEIANGNFHTRADDSGKDDISLIAADFNRMAEHIGMQMEELEAESETKQRMLDNLAHEMRTPLTSIRGYAEYLRDANIGEEEKIEALEFIISESERLKSIGERLLDEAFIRENKISPAETNLGEMIFGIKQKLSVKASHAGVTLRANAENITLYCDKLLTELLISNLTDNAIKACKGNGTVIISCGIAENGTCITVADNGMGMTEEQLAHITEPFYRTDRSRSREEGGTGLGLSLCKRIADAHGAKLEFSSQIGKGTKAIVTFTNP